MDTLELIDSAAKKVGSLRELSRQLNWNSGAIAGVKAGKRSIPPYRAAQLAKILGRDEDAAAWEALAAQAKEPERGYWLGKVKKVRSDFAIICVTFLALFAGTLPRAEAAITSIPEQTALNIHYAYRPNPTEDDRAEQLPERTSLAARRT